MRTKTLGMMVTVAFLLMCVAGTTTASAKAEIWYHDVINDVGSDSATIEIPFVFKMVSEWTWNTHLVYNDVFDTSGNLHVNAKWVSTGRVHWEAWGGNGVEWVNYAEYSQKLNTIGGNNELIIDFFTETQTSKQIQIYQNAEKMVLKDPATGEILYTYEYTVIAHMMVKWVNGELQFEIIWQIVRPET